MGHKTKADRKLEACTRQAEKSVPKWRQAIVEAMRWYRESPQAYEAKRIGETVRSYLRLRKENLILAGEPARHAEFVAEAEARAILMGAPPDGMICGGRAIEALVEDFLKERK